MIGSLDITLIVYNGERLKPLITVKHITNVVVEILDLQNENYF